MLYIIIFVLKTPCGVGFGDGGRGLRRGTVTDGSPLHKAPHFSLVLQILVILTSQRGHKVLMVNTALPPLNIDQYSKQMTWKHVL